MKYTEEHRIRMREFLTSVVNGDLSVIDHKTVGICGNMAVYMGKRTGPTPYFFVNEYARGWPQHNGNTEFPITPTQGERYWEGKKLVLRTSLCAYLLSQLDMIEGKPVTDYVVSTKMTYREEIADAFHLIVGSGSDVKLWVKILLAPLVLIAFLFACLWITTVRFLCK